MNWYKNDKELWKKVIETVSNETKRNVLMIEKDTIQSMILYQLSKKEIPFVFKGGTSLSKSYGIINRFSEDIDLSASQSLSESQRRNVKNIILEITENLGLIFDNPESVRSNYKYNKYVFKYKSMFVEEFQEIIVETSFYQIVYPNKINRINSYINMFCENNDIKLPLNCDELSFEMEVQSLQRTFIDKVFAICDYFLENKKNRYSRHLYDIAKIMPYINFNEGFKQLVKKVRKDRQTVNSNCSAQSNYVISDLLKKIIETHFFESDYRSLTEKILYEKYSYDQAISQGIKKLLNADYFD